MLSPRSSIKSLIPNIHKSITLGGVSKPSKKKPAVPKASKPSKKTQAVAKASKLDKRAANTQIDKLKSDIKKIKEKKKTLKTDSAKKKYQDKIDKATKKLDKLVNVIKPTEDTKVKDKLSLQPSITLIPTQLTQHTQRTQPTIFIRQRKAFAISKFNPQTGHMNTNFSSINSLSNGKKQKALVQIGHNRDMRQFIIQAPAQVSMSSVVNTILNKNKKN